MFEFEGDFFNAAYVVAITRDANNVLIYTAGGDQPFKCECADEEEARQKQIQAVEACREVTL